MAFIKLSDKIHADTKIMIFAEGTILKAKSFFTIYHHKCYHPIGNAVALIAKWAEQGAEIVYCTSRRGKQAMEMAELLQGYGFRGTRLYYRDQGQRYQDIVETVQPHVLIEDDCKSIGGSWQMCITYVAPQKKRAIHSIIVTEFQGIDALSADYKAL